MRQASGQGDSDNKEGVLKTRFRCPIEFDMLSKLLSLPRGNIAQKRLEIRHRATHTPFRLT